MEEIFYKVVSKSVHDVMVTMAQMDDLKAGEPYAKATTDSKSLGDICVIIGFSGPAARGTFVLHFSKPMAMHLLDKMFAIQSTGINEEVLDGLGEVTNIICGKIKTDVMAEGITEFNITVPTIIIGKDTQTYIKMDPPAHIFPFQGPGENQHLSIELKVKRT